VIEIFEYFSLAGDASSTLLVALFFDSVIYIGSLIALIYITVNHYKKANSKGALLILISFAIYAMIAVLSELFIYEYLAISIEIYRLIIKIVDAASFLVLIYGFHLICKQKQFGHSGVSISDEIK